MKQFGYKIYLDIDEDAWNWWSACNRVSHGTDWKKRISTNIAKKITGKTIDQANVFLIPYLRSLYKKDKETISDCKKEIKKEFDHNFVIACKRLEKITRRPLFRKNYKLYLTTFPRGPYWIKTGGIWLCIYWQGHIQTFLHEVLHFQFIHYWRNQDTEVAKLSEKQFEFLKESLTVILDKDFIDIAGSVDKGYPIHEELRQYLHGQWKKDKNFDILVRRGIKWIKESDTPNLS